LAKPDGRISVTVENVMSESTIQMVGVAVPTLRELRAHVLASGDPESAVNALRDAGYAGGESVHLAFESWLAQSSDRDSLDAGDLSLSEFGEKTAQFFHDAGWGTVTFSEDEAEGLAIIDIENCWEGPVAGDSGCQITTGLLASFFGTIAGYPIAVLETECCSAGSSRCRFLLGNSEVMQAKWEELSSLE
jgi:predicted hydrocarbon binding protein